MNSFDALLQARVAKELQLQQTALKSQLEEQEARISKLSEHNRCYRETIEYLESQLKHTTADLTTLAQSFSKSNGLQLSSMLLKKESQAPDVLEMDNSEEQSYQRDDTQLNQQESDPTPLPQP